jgi:hypothetical protein
MKRDVSFKIKKKECEHKHEYLDLSETYLENLISTERQVRNTL